MTDKFTRVARQAHKDESWRAKLVLHYEGRNFSGWQVQRNQRTVQGELAAILGRLCDGPAPKITAAGRTDRGVHATGQVASALIPSRFSPPELQRALNALAPSDIWIASVDRVPLTFHPRYDALSRTYVYRVGTTAESRSPFRSHWCWPLGHPLIMKRVERATSSIVGRHDFKAFAKSGQPERGVRCHVHSAIWRPSAWADGILEFEITADRFLHRMVRYLVRTLVEIGEGRRAPEEMALLLAAPGAAEAPGPAPAQGLFLTRVEYSSGSDQRDIDNVEAKGDSA